VRGQILGGGIALAFAGRVMPSFNVTPAWSWLSASGVIIPSTCAQYVLLSLCFGSAILACIAPSLVRMIKPSES